MAKKIAVIGIGNTLRRDDGIGIVILESLLKLYQRKEIDYFNFGIASFDLIHRLRDYPTVLLIDGINASLPAGALKIFALKDIVHQPDNLATSTHEINLKTIFELSGKFAPKTKIYVAGIQVEDISYREGLSDGLKEKKDEIARQISIFIEQNLLGCSLR